MPSVVPTERQRSADKPPTSLWAGSDLLSTRPALLFPDVSAPKQALRVVLADDHHFFREGLREILTTEGITVVGEASDATRAAKLVQELDPDVVVVDLKMPNATGVQAVRQIAAAPSGAHIVVLTASTDEADALDALEAGACCYLLKDTRPDELAAAIRLAAGGHAVLSRDVLRPLASHVRQRSRTVKQTAPDRLPLTARELDVIRLMAEGANNEAIGRELSISRHTVKQYVTNILEKLEVDSRVQAAVYAVRNDLV